MLREAIGRDPDIEAVLRALDDDQCRTIITELDEPMTASEVAETCDFPTSTTYRKLDILTDAHLLSEGTELRQDGHHATRYEVDFEAVEIALDEERRLNVAIERRTGSPDQRLASIWGEVRREA